MKIRMKIPARRAVVFISAAMGLLLMASAIAGISSNALIKDRIVSSQASSSFKYGQYYDMTVSSLNRWLAPSLSMDTQGHGYLMWMDQVNPTKGNYTLNYRMTTSGSNLTVTGGWKNWGQIHPLSNVTQNTPSNPSLQPFSDERGFAVGAPSNGKFYALFSNATTVNTTIGNDIVDVCVWDGSAVTRIATMTARWSSIFAYSNQSFNLRGACAKILFSSNGDLNLAWNNGTALFYEFVPYPYNFAGCKPEIVNNPTRTVGSMSEFAMIVNSTGQVHFVYSKASTDNKDDKELYWVYRLKATSTGNNNFSAAIQITSNVREDTLPAAVFDSSNNLLLTWSQFYHYDANSLYCYKVMYINVSAGVIPSLPTNSTKVISTDITPLTVSPSAIVKPSGIAPSIKLWNGKLNFFYMDSRQYAGVGSQDPGTRNMVWQCYSDSSNMASNHTLTVLSLDDTLATNAFPSVVAIDHDIFVAFVSISTGAPIHLVKIDYTGFKVTITRPTELNSEGLNQDARYSTPKPDNLIVSFNATEPDVSCVGGFKWDTLPNNTMSPDQRDINISGSMISLFAHTLSFTVADEVGNTVVITRFIYFSGTDWMMVLIIALVAVIAVAAVVILLVLVKYKKKFEQRQVRLKLGGKEKAQAKESWGEEAEAEEEEKEEKDDVDLKEDLKKVDM